MTADPKELFGIAFRRWIGGRREPMKNRGTTNWLLAVRLPSLF